MPPPYLLDHLPEHRVNNASLRKNVIRPPFPRIDRYDNSLFPFCINNWHNLDDTIKFMPTVSPKGNNFYAIRDSVVIKLLTKIRVTFTGITIMSIVIIPFALVA